MQNYIIYNKRAGKFLSVGETSDFNKMLVLDSCYYRKVHFKLCSHSLCKTTFYFYFKCVSADDKFINAYKLYNLQISNLHFQEKSLTMSFNFNFIDGLTFNS